MQQIAIMGVIFLAVFTQSLSGFGFGLVAMALLPAIVGIQTATPLVALVGITLEVVLVVRYRFTIRLEAILPVAAASLIGIPLGVIYLRRIDQGITLTVLGLVIVGYAVYSLLNIKPPVLKSSIWGVGVGILAGMLGGAYNTSGPPVIIYADSKRWPTLEFKGNLQAFFVLSGAMIAIAHLLSGNITREIWIDFLWSLPVIALGFILGSSLDRFLNQAVFRKIVLLLLLVMGLRLVLFS